MLEEATGLDFKVIPKNTFVLLGLSINSVESDINRPLNSDPYSDTAAEVDVKHGNSTVRSL